MIPFLGLRAQYESLRDEIDRAICGVIEGSDFILGPAVERFEGAFASACGVRHAVGVNSGTSALHLALLALGIGPGREVITVASTFVATVAAIRYTGATPVLVDIDPERFTMDPGRIEAVITPRTAAILPVHLYGQVADMDPILEIADRYGIPVIEDAAQAHGATYRGVPAGSLGRLGCFSFYPGKTLGAFGEAGAIVTDEEALAVRLRVMRDWGQAERSIHQWPCFNFRMDGLQGAVLDVKLRRLAVWVEDRRRIAAAYTEGLAKRMPLDVMALPRPSAEGGHAWHQFAIRVPARDRVREELLRRGVQTGVHYPLPVHLQPGFCDLGYQRGDLPISEALAERTLSLPIYPELVGGAVQRVIDTLADVIESLPGSRWLAADAR